MTSKIQSIIFRKDQWNILGAHNWLMKHNLFPIKSPHITKNFIRFRFKDPKFFKRFVTFDKGNGIEIIIGYY